MHDVPDPEVQNLSFSVITPTRNRRRYLSRAIESAARQTVPPHEHIIIDGGSTDGTLDLLSQFPNLRVVSEPDEGLYDAINKGIRMSSGDVIVILNDDDTLLPEALATAYRAFAESPKAQMFCGQAIIGQWNSTGSDVLVGSPRLQRLHPRAHAAGNNLFNARFFRRELFDTVGYFDTRYRISADTEFLGRCYLADVKVVARQVPVYRYGIHPDSLTFNGAPAPESRVLERITIAKSHLATAIDWRARRYWGRWLWWWTFYRQIRFHPRGGVGSLGRMFLGDPMGFLDFMVQFGWHLATRRKRRGRPVGIEQKS